MVFTTLDLGVDVQGGPWRNPVQQSRVKSFIEAMRGVRTTGLFWYYKVIMTGLFWYFKVILYPLVLDGSEVSGLASTTFSEVRASARGALGQGAKLRRAVELELALKGGSKLIPRLRSERWQGATQAIGGSCTKTWLSYTPERTLVLRELVAFAAAVLERDSCIAASTGNCSCLEQVHSRSVHGEVVQ
eukprot:5456067-Amphidinium_carterae.1